MNTNYKRKNYYQYFKCYNCQSCYKINRQNQDDKDEVMPSSIYKCKNCFSEFIEEIKENEMQAKKSVIIPTYSIKNKKSKNEIQIIKRKVKFKNNDPFVRDILKPLFPKAFNKKQKEILTQFQSTIGRINIFELDLNKNGPTDPQFIKKLKRIKYTNSKSPIKSCSICTDKFLENVKIIILSCGHVYHKYCIIPWLQLNNSCPVCRKQFPGKRII